MRGPPRILHINASDSGGASVAAMRLVHAQRAAGIDARMLVVVKSGVDEHVQQAKHLALPARAQVARAIAKRLGRRLASADPAGMRSMALVPTGLGRIVREIRPEIVHWHWVGAEVVSLSEMAQVGLPAVWTCHDQWAFCGAEHYAYDRRFTQDYPDTGKWDIDVWTYRRKRRAWRGWQPTLVCPSHWMAEEAGASTLAGNWPREVIPNTLDMDCYRPRDRTDTRFRFGVPDDKRLILFGAFGGASDPRKGFDLLQAAVQNMSPHARNRLVLATFGGVARRTSDLAGIPMLECGRIDDPVELAQLLSAADVFVAPSRQDNLPNTLLEAQSCGTPCVAFAIGGIPDIITCDHHGQLVTPFDTAEMARALLAVADSTSDALRERIRRDAIARFGSERVVALHRAVYERMLMGQQPT